MNFEDDLRLQFASWMAENGYRSDGDLRALAIRHQNIVRRTPPTAEWELRVSKELSARNLLQETKHGLAYFMQQAERGADLRPFLSANIDDADYKDLMFYDWGIYHFHLGTKLGEHGKRRGFIKGTDHILFAIADREHAIMYLLDIHPHRGGFTNQDLLRIIEGNWPEILAPYTARDITPSYENLSDEELDTLRQGGVNVLHGTPGGRTLFPMGGGIMGNRMSMLNLRAADHLLWRVHQAEAAFEASLSTIVMYFEREHAVNKADLSFHAQLNADGALEVSETVTGTTVWRDRDGWLVAAIRADS